MTSRAIATIIILGFVVFLAGLYFLTGGPERTAAQADHIADN